METTVTVERVAAEKIRVITETSQLYAAYSTIRVYNSLRMLMIEQRFNFGDGALQVDVSGLAGGVYTLELSGGNEEPITKRFILEGN